MHEQVKDEELLCDKSLADATDEVLGELQEEDIIDALLSDKPFLSYLLTAVKQGRIDKEYEGECLRRSINNYIQRIAESRI